MQRTLYDAAGGSAALDRLSEAWHRRCLEDPVVSHAFSHTDLHPQHTKRLAAYWAEQLGGPADFTAGMGDHSQVLRMHSGNGEHEEMDHRALQCFALALDDAHLPADPELRRALLDWFAWMITALDAYPASPADVPDGLPLPHWSWDGPVSTTG
jgi:hemoglobin